MDHSFLFLLIVLNLTAINTSFIAYVLFNLLLVAIGFLISTIWSVLMILGGRWTADSFIFAYGEQASWLFSKILTKVLFGMFNRFSAWWQLIILIECDKIPKNGPRLFSLL